MTIIIRERKLSWVSYFDGFQKIEGIITILIVRYYVVRFQRWLSKVNQTASSSKKVFHSIVHDT